MPLKALQIHGPYKGMTGYEHHVREFVLELHRQGIAIQLIDFPEWNPIKLPVDQQNPWFHTLNRPVGARIALHFMMPHHVEPIPGMANVNSTMFEATRIPRLWVNAARRHDLVIVPTESSRCAWVDSGVPSDRVRVAPFGINARLYSPLVTRRPLPQADFRQIEKFRVRFLNVSAWDPRKNLMGLIRAWIRATSSDDDAVLAIKSTHFPLESSNGFWRRMNRIQKQIGKRADQAAPIRLIRNIFTDEEMARLYASFTHYISMSFGEGWDQPMVEAAASGLRLIAPDHSAYASYLDSSVAHLIPSQEVPVERTDGIQSLFDGASWWKPDPDSAVALIQSAIEGTDELPCSARDRILSRFTWENATRQLIAILEECELPTAHRPLRW